MAATLRIMRQPLYQLSRRRASPTLFSGARKHGAQACGAAALDAQHTVIATIFCSAHANYPLLGRNRHAPLADNTSPLFPQKSPNYANFKTISVGYGNTSAARLRRSTLTSCALTVTWSTDARPDVGNGKALQVDTETVQS